MFFEDPALLFGLPLAIIGGLGLLLAFSLILAPEHAPGQAVVRRGHPDEAEYIKIGLILGTLTAIEVVVYYFNIPRSIFVVMLIGLSAVKFTAVVMFFMHLKFDSRIFTTAFVTGFLLAAAIFSVVLVTLGSNLI
jgi:cytochrome c oxidase subunit 4